MGRKGKPSPAFLPSRRHMRFIHFYLIGYFVLLIGAGLALWQAGAFSVVSPLWVLLGTSFAVGLGILLVLTADKPPVSQD
jgi:hypothetical protein